MKIKFLITGALCLLLSCTRNREQAAIETALADAGSNGRELQMVLDHYTAPEDSLQLRAARFLIANMPYHFGYYGEEIDKYGRIFSIIDTLSYRKEGISMQDKMHIGDSLLTILGNPDPDLVKKIPDTRIVSASYLITDIDFAFKAWKTPPWSRNVGFDDFCDFILPYRVRDEQVQCWRPGCYDDYTRMAKRYPHPDSPLHIFWSMSWDLGYETNFTLYFNKYFPFPKSFNDVLLGKIGGCETTSFFSVSAMRAAGLPVSSDFIPQWGNVNSGHYLMHLVDHAPVRQKVTNINRPVNTWSLIEWSINYDEHRHHFTPDELPPGMDIQYIYTVPKIYRYTYSVNEDLAGIYCCLPEKEISPYFRGANFKDITSEYIDCSDFSLRISETFKKFRIAYLCAFDISGWKPVAIKAITKGQALFKDLGRYVVYLPAVFQDDHFIPAANPFFIDSSGIVHTLTKEPDQKQDMRLVRKTALYAYTSYHSEVVKGGKFEGCEEPEFKHPVLLDSIEKYPFYMNEVLVSQPKYYRYLRYVAPHTEVQEPDNIAEVQFYCDDSTRPLKGKFIGSEGSPGHDIGKAFDNNMDSYYENKTGKNGWIGIDLGEKSRAKVSSIKFCPRNDTNCIIPGEDYELFYWDDEWISLGRQKANSDHLDYRNVPAGTLYWLKCTSGGHEERIFTYQAGKQVWW